jgi:hypothetical protein
MFAEIRTSVLIGLLGLGTLGCAGVREVRYVYQDGESGVIGLPENTSRWPTYYRQHAEELMAKHFPEGYEIVRAEEVDEGSRTLTINGTKAAELDAGGPTNLLTLAKLGRTSTRTQSDTVKIKECRIVYKKAEPKGAPKHSEYAEQAAWTPPTYIDPNAKARQPATAKAEVNKGPDVPMQAKSHDEKPAREPKEIKADDSQGKEHPASLPPALEATVT